VLVIVAWAYNPYEFWTVLKAIRRQGWEFKVISTDPVIEEERTVNERFKVDTVEDFNLDEIKDYAAMVLVSGSPIPTEKFYFNQETRDIVIAFNKLERPIAAMCAMVPAIRYVLEGKRVTAFPTTKVLSLLKREGAIITDNSLEVDGYIITAQHEEVIDEMMSEVIRRIQ